MGNRLKEIMPGLEHHELVKIKKDLDTGAVHLKRLINSQIKKNEKEHERYCSTCQSKIDPESVNNFTLIFGPESFKKKASFCAVDCLEYFLHNVKQLKKR